MMDFVVDTSEGMLTCVLVSAFESCVSACFKMWNENLFRNTGVFLGGWGRLRGLLKVSVTAARVFLFIDLVIFNSSQNKIHKRSTRKTGEIRCLISLMRKVRSCFRCM